MTVTQHGRARIYPDGWFEMGFPDAHARVLIDRGRGFKRFRRKVLTSPLTERSGRVVLDDGLLREFVLSYDDAIGDVVFPAPGQVRIAFEYEDPATGRVRSNVVTLRIDAPEAEERRAWEAVRALPGRGQQFYLELTEEDDAPDLSDAASQALLGAFPRSVYVQGARVRSLGYRIGHPSDRFEAGDPSSPAPMDHRERERLASQRVAALVTEAEALVSDLAGGQFEPDALVLLAVTYAADGRDELAHRAWQQVVDRFPARRAADEASEALAPDEDDADDEGPAPSPRPRP
jgi:hypothetical protein